MNNNTSKALKRFGIKEYDFLKIIEEKDQGILRVYEDDKIPFPIKRVFTVTNAFGGSQRGMHAHIKCNQLLCCVSGKVEVICKNGVEKLSLLITPDSFSYFIPSGIWAEQNYLNDNSSIIVFCDQPYDELDYIRNYSEYLKWKKSIK